jgi:signal transduction histidine kinase
MGKPPAWGAATTHVHILPCRSDGSAVSTGSYRFAHRLLTPTSDDEWMRSASARHTPQATDSRVPLGRAEQSEISSGRSTRRVIAPGALLLERITRLGWISVLAGVLAVLAANQVAARAVYLLGIISLAMATSALAIAALHRGVAAYIRNEDRRTSKIADAAQRQGVTLAADTIRHHVGNRLAVVVGYSELLVDDASLPGDAREQANKVLTSAMAAAEVVHKLNSQLARVDLDTRVVGTQVLRLDGPQGEVSQL